MVVHQWDHASSDQRGERVIPISDWHVVRSTFLGSAAALVVNLGGGHVTMTEELLHLANIYARIQQQGSDGGAEGMGTIEPHTFLAALGSLAT